MSAETPDPLLAKIDLHGYRPRDFIGQPMAIVVQQAWEMGAERLRFTALPPPSYPEETRGR